MLLGLYKHYKGGLYLVESVARHTETHEEFVVYRSLAGDFNVWIRPKKMFESMVECEGKIIDRFVFIKDPSAETPIIIN